MTTIEKIKNRMDEFEDLAHANQESQSFETAEERNAYWNGINFSVQFMRKILELTLE